MAGKPELSAAPGVQNVVVYVSNDNFAQAYTVNQNVVGQDIHNGTYANAPHTVAPLGPGKGFPPDKQQPIQQQQHVVEASGYNSQTGYFANQAVISQNGFPQQQQQHVVGGYKGVENGLKGPFDDRTIRTDVKECGGVGGGGGDYDASSGFVVMGGDGTSVRCDSVRSETAESSCSSLSSADEGMLVVPQPDMVVYDNSVNVRHGVVVAVGGNHPSASASIVGSLAGPVQQTIVPYGWKRLSTNGVVIYISPSNTALSSLDQVKEYLLTPGTCKCGLECPLKFDSVFNFDPKVIGKPWTLSPDTNTGDLTKLCNHKRKIIAMASLGCKPPDPNKLPKDYIKKKKRKLCSPYTNVSVSQILAQREKANIQQPFNKENMGSPQFVQHQPQPPQQIWQHQQQQPANIQEFQAAPPPQNNAQFYRYQNPELQNRMDSPVVMSDGVVVQSGTNQNISNQMQISQPMPPQQPPPPPHQHHQQQPPQQLQHQIIGPNGQILNQMGMTQVVNSGMVIQSGQQTHQQRVFINGQPNEPSGPGRPVQMVPVSISTGRPDIVQRMPQPQCFYGPNYGVVQQQIPQFDPSKNVRPFRQSAPPMPGNVVQKVWNPRVPLPSQHSPQSSNVYERVPPLPQHQAPPTVWQDEINRKKFKQSKGIKKRSFNIVDSVHRTSDAHSPCPNVDVRQIQSDGRQGLVNHFPSEQQQSSSPSFIEDPSGYLAQQTALLNSTISRQTGVNSCSSYICNSPVASMPNQMMASSQANGVPLPSNIQVKQQHQQPQQQQQPQHPQQQQMQMQPQQHQHQQQLQSYGSPVRTQSIKTQIPAQYNQIIVSQGMPDSSAMNEMNCQGCAVEYQQQMMDGKEIRIFPRPSSQPGTPSSSGTGEDPVTSSNYMEKHPSPDSRPIQGGTVSTSNVSPVEDSPDPSTSHTPTPPHQEPPLIQIPYSYQSEPNQNQFQLQQQQQQQQQLNQNMQKQEMYCQPHRGIVTTMASGRTVGSNTITSVLAGRANTATVSITNPVTSNQTISNQNGPQTTAPQIPATKSPLEMVQSVVSSIKVPQSQPNIQQLNMQSIPQQVVKQSLPPGHIFVSSGGQLIMASTSGQVMPPPPPPKIVTNQTSMPPISVSPMITNVTASVTQMIPAVAQQVLGQQTVLVNALPAPFVIQPGVTMTMDGMNMQIPHLVTGNVIQQQIQIDNSDPRRVASLLSPENKKKGKKRKISSQTVASMLHIAAQQNSGVVGFPQQIQMAHSPQGITAGPVMQALTIVPGKAGAPPQLVMNGQLPNTQQIINSQSQQINLLQPVNLAQGMVQNFPTIQQFVLPNLTGMVMNADGTATIVQDTNIGMQLQLQNVNGQNVLTPVQNNQVFTGGQSIIPAGMVIRPQGKIIQQQHSPGAQFLSPNGGGQFVAQFNGQLSPLVANVSPGQQVTFSTAPQPIRPNNNVQQPPQEFIQCGQTLMVPANIAASTSNQQNTTFVQQNTTIVQQQTTMLSNNQGNQNQTLNVDQNFLISEKQAPVQTVVLQQRQSPQQLPPNYRHSVSTQTAVNQNGPSVTTNTFCQTSTSSAGSPPDTTTHSPLAPGGQSPPTADTTTHSGSTDDGLSPAPSNCSGSCSDIVNLQRQQQSSMAMVHCISSSEPDSAEMNAQNSEFDWRSMSMTMPKMEFTEISSGNGNGGQPALKKPMTPTHVAYAESSTMVHFATDSMKQQEAVVSSRNYEKLQAKRKHGDTLVVMEMRHMHSSLFDDDDEEGAAAKSPRRFSPGDLVWGPARGCPAWPGKIVDVKEETVTVRWFGSEKFVSDVDLAALRTLTEGLEAHHRAGKKSRTSRKLNAQLEKAIQEAMVELDKMSESTGEKDTEVSRKSTGRLRSSQK